MPEQNDRYFADEILRCTFMNEKSYMSIKFHWSMFPLVLLTESQHEFLHPLSTSSQKAIAWTYVDRFSWRRMVSLSHSELNDEIQRHIYVYIHICFNYVISVLGSHRSKVEDSGPQSPGTHYSDVIMRAMASQITGVSIVCSTVCSCADQRKHQSSASLAFVQGNPPMTDGFLSERANNAKNISILWRHHGLWILSFWWWLRLLRYICYDYIWRSKRMSLQRDKRRKSELSDCVVDINPYFADTSVSFIIFT